MIEEFDFRSEEQGKTDKTYEIALRPKHLEDFANERSPHSLVHFLKELAADFHSFYETNPVLVENDTVANSRLIITKATQIVLQNGLELLSVKPLSKM